MAAGAVCLQRLEGGERNGIGWNRNIAGLDLLDRGSALGIGFLELGRRLGFLAFAIVLGGSRLLLGRALRFLGLLLRLGVRRWLFRLGGLFRRRRAGVLSRLGPFRSLIVAR